LKHKLLKFLSALLFFVCLIQDAVFASELTTEIKKEKSNLLIYPSKTTIYSESTYISKYQDFINSTKLTHDILMAKGIAKLYLGVFISQDSKSTELSKLNDNYVAGLLGVSTVIYKSPIQFFVEGRTLNKDSKNELRAGLTLYDFSNLYNFDAWMNLFSEIYGESIYISRLEDNVFSNLWSRIGGRLKFTSHAYTDAYLEGAVKIDRLGYYYENTQEIRPGIRAGYRENNFLISLSYHYGFGKYSGREYKDKNINGEYFQDPRLLLVLFGEF
jgi:hypothetical protein